MFAESPKIWGYNHGVRCRVMWGRIDFLKAFQKNVARTPIYLLQGRSQYHSQYHQKLLQRLGVFCTCIVHHCSTTLYALSVQIWKSLKVCMYIYIYIISRCQKSQNVKLLAVSLGEAHRKHTYAQKKQNICLVTHAGYCSYQLFIPAKNPYEFFVTFLFPLSIISMNPDL